MGKFPRYGFVHAQVSEQLREATGSLSSIAPTEGCEQGIVGCPAHDHSLMYSWKQPVCLVVRGITQDVTTFDGMNDADSASVGQAL